MNRETEKGVSLLTDLYVDTDDPTYIFNQGRCYEQGNQCEEAVVRFREYLRKTATGNQQDRTEVAKHIADCEALLAKKGEGTQGPATSLAPAPAPAPAPATATVPAPATESPPSRPRPTPAAVVTSEGEEDSYPRDDSRPGFASRVAGIVTMSAGGAFVFAGAAFHIKHDKMINQIQGEYNDSTEHSAQTYRTLSITGYAVGAACLVGGSILYWLGYRAGNAVITPTLVEGRAGLTYSRVF